MNIRKFLYHIIALLSPPRCPFCNTTTYINHLVCSQCIERSRLNIDKFKIYITDDKFVTAFSPFIYQDDVRTAIHRFKFRLNRTSSDYFSNQILLCINQLFKNINFDVVTCVPIHRNSQTSFNPAQEIAKDIAYKINVPYRRLLKKTKQNLKQHTLPAKERALNVQDVFNSINISNIKNKNILLCDDVITTGNTIKECARVLLENGASNVICASIARSKLIKCDNNNF